MRIKSLKVTGFKSFLHPIEIAFKQHGITVIVGPNGCGKSNVVDAIRWVLGEQSAKHLRGDSMEDVIFAGSAFQKPSGLAEVTMTFSNLEGDTLSKYHEYTEIEVTRRLYRSGESVYLINKTPVRLLDVRELFMDTGIGGKGYSIIEQGRVGELVSAKPAERRYIIEEVAGIVKFQAKRQAAEKRLAATEQNLSRIADIVQELIQQQAILSEQAKRAEFYLQIQQDYQNADQQLSVFRWTQASQKEQTLSNSQAESQTQIEQLQVKKIQQQQELESIQQQQQQQEEELEALRQGVFELSKASQSSLNQKQLEEQTLVNHHQWIDKHTQEIEDLANKLQQFHQETEGFQLQQQQLQQKQTEIQQILETVEETRQTCEDEIYFITEDLQSRQKQLLTIHTQLTTHHNQKAFSEERILLLQERHQQFDLQTIASQQSKDQAEKGLQKLQIKIEGIQRLSADLMNRTRELEEHHQELNREVESINSSVQTHHYEWQSLSSKKESFEKIQQHYEDFGDSVKALFQLLEKLQIPKAHFGILGMLAEWVTVDPNHLPRVGPIIAPYLEWIVIEKSSYLNKLEEFCVNHHLAQLQFLTLDRPVLQKLPMTIPSGAVCLSQWIQWTRSDQISGIFDSVYFLENPLPWEDWIRDLGVYSGIEWVSPQGSLTTAKHTVQMGSPQKSSLGFLARQHQIKDLQTQLIELTTILADLKEQYQQKKEFQDSLQEHIQTARAQQHTYELEKLHHQKESEHRIQERDRYQKQMEQTQNDLENIKKEIQLQTQKLHEMVASFEKMQSQREILERQVEEDQESIAIKRSILSDLSEHVLLERIRSTEISEQLKNIQQQIKRIEGDHHQGQHRLEHLKKSRSTSEQSIGSCQRRIDELTEQVQLLESQQAILQDQLEITHEGYRLSLEIRTQQTALLKELHQGLEGLTLQRHQMELQLTEQRLQRQQVEEYLLTQYSVPLAELLITVDFAGVKENSLFLSLRKLKEQLSEIGPVNLAAPEQYASLMERMTFLQTQSADLNQAMDDLKTTIREINAESRRRFKEAFQQLNERFQKTFVTLFGGGEASMVLTESEDVLEAGIEIIAQPPGKKLQNLNLLSGGEKALTAISLIFSIFLIKPSPFCLLDEVDAPLDDANVGRFNSLIQQVTADSQFIIITHNKKTMEIGELLYGVTMEEAGISKVVSVAFDESPSKVA